MPKNKLANVVADYLLLHREGGRRVCELFLKATEYAVEKEGLDLQGATLQDLAGSIGHNLKGAIRYRDKDK